MGKQGRSRIYTIKIYCSKCGTLLLKYRKEGVGHLIKCYKDGIIEDHTNGDLRCPKCKTQFAKETIIHGRPSLKIIQGRVYVRG